MINKVEDDVINACEKGDFLNASTQFHSGCQREKDCLCRGKDIKDISMCMISHLQYFTMMENEKLSEEILENYVSWRSITKTEDHKHKPQNAKRPARSDPPHPNL